MVSRSRKVGRYRDILLTHGIPSAPGTGAYRNRLTGKRKSTVAEEIC
jgi:hypothetical protein